MKKRFSCLVIVLSLVIASPEIAHAQQAETAPAPAQAQTDFKSNRADKIIKPEAEQTKTRCRTPVCFRDNPGGYFTGPPKKNY